MNSIMGKTGSIMKPCDKRKGEGGESSEPELLYSYLHASVNNDQVNTF